ncbi:MAG: polysaccharide pyruvyl transferase family protein [Phocaeicola sp.]
MRREICILTQPLHNNYGGLIQAYALQKVLLDMGHNVVTDERPLRNVALTLKRRALSQGKHIVYRVLGKRAGDPLKLNFPTQHELDSVGKYTKKFVRDHINTVDFTRREPLPTDEMQNRFDTFVVGSDQVWRQAYSYIPNYFLDFAEKRNDIKRISYAASFGVSELDFTEDSTTQARRLAPLFDAISVREDSAVDLCRDQLGVEATHVLDPTLLLSKEDYIRLVESDGVGEGIGKLMSYVLDESLEKQQVIERLSKTLNLTPRKVMPSEHLSLFKKCKLENIIYPKPSEWIRGFMDAEYVVTDSFHGTVFAIIFNRPFIAIANKDRGLTRFTSLLKIFNLEDRLIYNPEDLTDELIHRPIDFDRVNAIRQEWITKSLGFLKKALRG